MKEYPLYKKEVICAYRELPVLNIDDLKFGDIINWTPAAKPYAMWDRVTQVAIVELQKREFPESSHVYSTHSTIYVGKRTIFNVTVPVADYLRLDKVIIPKKV